MASTNWAQGYELKTGKAQENDAKRTHEGITVKDIYPSSTGGKEFVPSAFSPRTGLLVPAAQHFCHGTTVLVQRLAGRARICIDKP
jgi:hypothetical protein